MWETLLAGGVWRGEFVNQRKNGETYVEAEIISPIRNPAGEVTHYLAIKQDVTQRRRIENDLAAHRDSLEHKVEARTAALNEANQALAAARDKAEDATRDKAAFLANTWWPAGMTSSASRQIPIAFTGCLIGGLRAAVAFRMRASRSRN